MYKEEDIYEFVFQTFDKDCSGNIDEEEFLDLARTVNNAEVGDVCLLFIDPLIVPSQSLPHTDNHAKLFAATFSWKFQNGSGTL